MAPAPRFSENHVWFGRLYSYYFPCKSGYDDNSISWANLPNTSESGILNGSHKMVKFYVIPSKVVAGVKAILRGVRTDEKCLAVE